MLTMIPHRKAAIGGISPETNVPKFPVITLVYAIVADGDLPVDDGGENEREHEDLIAVFSGDTTPCYDGFGEGGLLTFW